MTVDAALKPSFEEWLYWSQVVVDRLNEIVRVYNKPPFADVFMPELDRQNKLAATLNILKRLTALTDDADMPTPVRTPESLAAHDEDIIAQIDPLFADVLDRLPDWSMDMQSLLKSPWFDNCTGRTANDLFRGPGAQLSHGIGSGQTVHGRLPAMLEGIRERELMGDSRPPRVEKPPAGTQSLQREEIARRWGRRNSAFLRSAGRVE